MSGCYQYIACREWRKRFNVEKLQDHQSKNLQVTINSQGYLYTVDTTGLEIPGADPSPLNYSFEGDC